MNEQMFVGLRQGRARHSSQAPTESMLPHWLSVAKGMKAWKAAQEIWKELKRTKLDMMKEEYNNIPSCL